MGELPFALTIGNVREGEAFFCLNYLRGGRAQHAVPLQDSCLSGSDKKNDFAIKSVRWEKTLDKLLLTVYTYNESKIKLIDKENRKSEIEKVA